MIYCIHTQSLDPDLLSVKARDAIERCDTLVYENPELLTLRSWTKPTCQVLSIKADKAIKNLLPEHQETGKSIVFIANFKESKAGIKFLDYFNKNQFDYERILCALPDTFNFDNASQKPLENKRIVITRNRQQSQGLKTRLTSLGAEVLEVPLIEVSDFCEPDTLDEVFSEIAQYEIIVFTSANGVRSFFHFFFNRFKDIRCLGGMRIACIGSSTAAEVERMKLQVDILPKESVSESLADAIIEWETLDNLKVLVVTGNLNSDVLVKKLEEEGRAIVDTLPVYKTQKTDLSNNATAKDFKKNGADAIIFASSSAVQSFVGQAEALQLSPKANKPIACSIGPITSKTMREIGMPVDIEAKESSMSGLVQSLIQHFEKSKAVST